MLYKIIYILNWYFGGLLQPNLQANLADQIYTLYIVDKIEF